MGGFHLLQIYFLWVAISVVAHSLAQFLGASSIYLLLWGTVTSLYVSIRKTPSGISFLMLPGSTITSVSVSAGSPEPGPPMQTQREPGAGSAPQTRRASVPAPSARRAPSRFHFSRASHSLAGRWSLELFWKPLQLRHDVTAMCSISVSILVRRFLLLALALARLAWPHSLFSTIPQGFLFNFFFLPLPASLTQQLFRPDFFFL